MIKSQSNIQLPSPQVIDTSNDMMKQRKHLRGASNEAIIYIYIYMHVI